MTGASRGLGRHFARQLLERGAARVYATARHPGQVDVPGADVLPLDITDPASWPPPPRSRPTSTPASTTPASPRSQNLVTGDLDKIRLELDTHFYGTLAVDARLRAGPRRQRRRRHPQRAVRACRGWSTRRRRTPTPSAKAAAVEPHQRRPAGTGRARATLVTGVHLAATDTDMMAGWDIPKERSRRRRAPGLPVPGRAYQALRARPRRPTWTRAIRAACQPVFREPGRQRQGRHTPATSATQIPEPNRLGAKNIVTLRQHHPAAAGARVPA